NGTLRHVLPSVDSSTTPARPTIQHTNGEGADPAERASVLPVVNGSQLVPPFVERSMKGPVTRQRTSGSGDLISTPVPLARRSAACDWRAGAANAGAAAGSAARASGADVAGAIFSCAGVVGF